MSGLCVHIRVGLTRLKRSNKRLLPKYLSKLRMMRHALVSCKKLGHLPKNCPFYKKARKCAQVISRRCYGCNKMGDLVDSCLNKQNMHKANQGHICYVCRIKGHLSYDCPIGNVPKPNKFGYDDMLRVNSNRVSTSKVMCSPQTSTKAFWVPKHLLTNSKGPKKGWVP